MLRKTLTSIGRSGSIFRGIASSSDGNTPKDLSPKDILGKNILDAVNEVVDDLHGSNAEAKKTSKSTLLNKLMSHEKDTFVAATTAQTSEMLDDKSLLNLLDFVAEANKKKSGPKTITIRKEQQAMVMLRKEIYYQAKQEGYSANEAQQIAEKAVEEARQRIVNIRQTQATDSKTEEVKAKPEYKDDREKRLYEYAYNMAEQMLSRDEDSLASKSKLIVKPDPNIESLLKTTRNLGVFKTLDGMKESSLLFWQEWDLRAAKIMNQSLGPENSFEEQIEWTNKGKQWPYPINNEYLLGEEENVSFIDHIFLERHLPSLGIPKSGPIAHFMHLVCVGLSKNPYMTAKKKMEHLRWFANYFNTEKQKLVHRLHEEEQIAAAQSL